MLIHDIKSPGKSLEILSRFHVNFSKLLGRAFFQQNRIICIFHDRESIRIHEIVCIANFNSPIQTWIRVLFTRLLLHVILLLPFEIESLKLMGHGNCGNSKPRDIIGAYVKIWRFIFSSPRPTHRFFFIDLFTFNVYDRTRESPLL